MRIHKEGHITLALLLILFAAILWVCWLIIPASWINSLLTLAAFGGWIFYAHFFRSPKRPSPQQSNHIIAPADGLVVLSEDLEYCEILHRKCKKLAIFMSGWDVHINWSPVSGTVTFHRYYPGKHFLARNPKASDHNERSMIVIEKSKEQVLLLKQVAGIMARRVVTLPKAGQEVQQGDEIGFIKLGSRIELFLPTDIQILVRPGQKVIGKVTALATWS